RPRRWRQSRLSLEPARRRLSRSTPSTSWSPAPTSTPRARTTERIAGSKCCASASARWPRATSPAEETMMRILIPASLAAALAVLAGGQAARPASAEDVTRIAANPSAAADDMPTGSARLAAGDAAARFVALGVGKSIVVELSRDVRDVLVSNPKIANAVIRSSRRAYLIAGEVGQTNIYFFDGEGRQIAGF